MLYFIADDITQTSSQELKLGVRIFKLPVELGELLPDFEGPFKTLDALRNQSIFARQLQKYNPKRYLQIFDSKNIIQVKDFILTSEEQSFSKEFMRRIEHIMGGESKKDLFKGGHFFDDRNMQIQKIYFSNPFTEIMDVELKIYDPINDKYFQKRSTIFPIHWDRTRFFHEILFAIENKISINDNSHISITKSGVPVHIKTNGTSLKTIYPAIKKP